MLRRLVYLITLAFSACAQAQSPGARYMPGEVLVKFKPGTSLVQTAFSARYRVQSASVISRLGVTRMTLAPSMTPTQALHELRKLKAAVVYAEPNYINDYSYIPNDPGFALQYHHQNVRSPQAWDVSFGSIGVTVAICDSGVQLNHEDLAPKLLAGTDTFDHDSDPSDELGHGTFVAGLAAAATDNGVGISGTGFNCRILPVRVGGNFGVPNSSAAEGIAWAADNGANVINLSFGGSIPSLTMKDAIDYATTVKNAVVVGSAGNSNTSLPLYPAAFPNVISVGATDENDERAEFSNFGTWVDVAAPGLDVYSTEFGGGYATHSGTSYSAPIVSGIAGLVWSRAGLSATSVEIRSYLEQSCDNVGTWVNFGRVNALAALDAVTQIDEIDFDVETASVFTGNFGGGNIGSLRTTDGSMYFVFGAPFPSLGLVAALQGEFSVPDDPDDVNSLSVTFATAGPPRTTQFVYVWNWQTSGYELVKTLPISQTVKDTEAILSRPYGRYINPTTNKVRVLLRAVGPARYVKQMVYSVDRLQLKAFVRTH
ncbi:MAG: S8 family serine peptidase [Fimbriimonadaceae bacterium]|nr:S8 family serine peptidase [Fimbriimonadaceae bacterium]